MRRDMEANALVHRRSTPAFRVRSVLVGAAAVAAMTIGPATAQEWKPTKNVEIVVISGPGGAADRQARVTQKLLQTLPGLRSITVVNKPGGGGIIGLTYLAQHTADPHYISSLATSVLTQQILGVSPIRYQDLTPLNILIREYVVAWTHADSPIGSGKDLVARLRQDPKSVSFGFATAPGNQNHIVIAMIAKAAGVDPKAVKTVVYSSGGQGMMSALGGHVDVWVGTAGGALPHMESGKIRMLGISSEQRQPGAFAAVPTFKEQGLDAAYYAWRGFVAPKGLTAAQIAFWDQAFAKIVAEDQWKKELEENAWAGDFKNSAETRRYLDREYPLLERILGELGLTKK
jgi:putative tricarboxylic transport membrane protein